jgi:hypothetical protein
MKRAEPATCGARAPAANSPTRPRRLWTMVIPLIACGPMTLHAQPQVSGSQPPEAALNIIPMLSIVWSGPGPATCGAGIVVGEASDQGVYVVTARHVLRNDDGTSVQRINLFFRGRPGEPVVGTELTLGIKPEYDLTVLVVRGLPPDVRAGFQYNVLSDDVSSDTNVAIKYIGHRNCDIPWDYNRTPAPVTAWDPWLETEGTLPNGYSGGGAFDTRWNLRGMTLVDDARTGMALPIRVIRSELARVGIPMRLRPSDTGTQLENATTADNEIGIFGRNIPAPVMNELRSRIRDAHRISDVAFFPPSGYVLIEDEHTPRCAHLPQAVENKLRGIAREGKRIRRILTFPFSPSSWLVLYGDNEWDGDGLPRRLVDELNAFRNWNRPIRDVTLLPGDGWLIIDDNDSVVAVNGGEFEQRLRESARRISQPVVKDSDTWFFLRGWNDGYTHGIGDDLYFALTTVRTPNTRIVTFAFTPAGGWILLTDHNRTDVSQQ